MKATAVLVIILATWIQLWAQTKRCEAGVKVSPVGFWTWPSFALKVVEGSSSLCLCVSEVNYCPGETNHRDTEAQRIHSARDFCGKATWPTGTQVNVYAVESDFQPGEVSALLAPLASWNAVPELTGSRVKFGVETSPKP